MSSQFAPSGEARRLDRRRSTDFQAPIEEARATTYRVTLTGVEMDHEPVQGFARGECKRDALRRVDPETIPADLEDVDTVGMIEFGSAPADGGRR